MRSLKVLLIVASKARNSKGVCASGDIEIGVAEDTESGVATSGGQ